MINKVNEFKQKYDNIKKLRRRLVSSSMSKQRTEKHISTNSRQTNGSLKNENFIKTKQSQGYLEWRKKTESKDGESERADKTLRKFDFRELLQDREKEPRKSKIQKIRAHNAKSQASKLKLFSDKHIKLSQFNRLNHQNQSKKLFLNNVCQTQPKQTQNRKKMLWGRKQSPRASGQPKQKGEIKFINLEDMNQDKKQYLFIEKLKYHEVFFCVNCYRYIFAVEKSYHYPKCQNKAKTELDYNFGLQRLSMIEELSFYTSTKAELIQKKIEQVRSNMYEVDSPVFLEVQYLALSQIETAFDFIFCTFIKDKKGNFGEEDFCGRIITDTACQL